MNADEPNSSPSETTSTSSVDESNKETEKKEADAEAMRTRCKVCFKEISPKRQCGGHGGGRSGGSTSDEKASQGDDLSLASKPGSIVDTVHGSSMTGSGAMGEGVNIDSKSQQSGKENFNPEVIVQLVTDNLLKIDNDRDSMTLTIKLQCKPNALSKEQRHELKKFMESVLKELNEFKKENRISISCEHMTKDEEGNIISFRITLPTLTLYDAFIQRLANNLLPTPKPEIQAENEFKKEQKRVLNPFSIELKHSNTDKRSLRDEVERNEDLTPQSTEDDEEQTRFNPSPFSTKPKDW